PRKALELRGDNILRLSDVPGTGVMEQKVRFLEPRVYPNPAPAEANVVFTLPKSGKIRVDIFDMQGRLVQNGEFQLEAGDHSIVLPQQNNGMYMVSLRGCGIQYATKWMCMGRRNGQPIRIGNTHVEGLQMKSRTQTNVTKAATETPDVVYMQYNLGDLLRFTGSNGEMSCIVMKSPQRSHTVTFSMYACKDAAGNCYPIIEAGGLLWMAENLKMVRSSKIALCNNAGNWKESPNKAQAAYFEYDQNKADRGAYYTYEAAKIALPDGWRLPTAGELEAVTKNLNGSAHAGNALKYKGDGSQWLSYDESLDSVSLSIQPNGSLNPDGTFSGDGLHAYIMTRSAIEGKPMYMELKDGSDSALMGKQMLAAPKTAFTVRGVRPALSPYNAITAKMLGSDTALANLMLHHQKDGAFDDTPLGKNYKISSGEMQLVRENNRGLRILTTASGKPLRLDSSGEANRMRLLKKTEAQRNQSGRTNLVKVTWSEPFRGGTFTSSDTTTYFKKYNGKLILTVYGDSTTGYKQLYYDTLPYSYSMPTFETITLVYFFQGNSGIVAVTANNIHSFTKGIAEPIEHFAERIHLRCADYNGDGIDDIITGVAGNIQIIDGSNYRTLLAERSYPTTNVRVAAGDVDGNDTTDIVVLYETLGSTDFSKPNSITMEVFCKGLNRPTLPTYSSVVVPATAKSNCLTSNGSNKEQYLFNYMDVAVGDVTGDNSANIVCLVSPKRSLNNSNSSTINYTINATGSSIYVFKYANGGVSPLITTAIAEPAHVDFGNCNLRLARLGGFQRPMDIIGLNRVWRWNGSTFTSVYDFGVESQWVPSGNMAVGNFDRNSEGRDQVAFNTLLMDLQFGTGKTQQKSFTLTTRLLAEKSGGFANQTHSTANAGSLTFPFTIFPLIGGYTTSYNGMTLEYPTLAAIRGTESERIYQFESRQYAMSEPRIYALLAAPPYFADYDYPYGPPCTSWGKSTSSASGEGRSSSNSASLIFGYEQDITIPMFGAKLGSIDFETKLTYDYTFGSDSTSTTEYGIEYSTFTDDAVAMQLTPFTIYNYKCVSSANEDEIGSILSISVPGRPANTIITLQDYMLLRADNQSIPDLTKVFHHTPGDPFSYPDDPKKVGSNYGLGGILWGNNNANDMVATGSGGRITLTITETTETSTIKENSFNLEAQLVVNFLGAKAGFGYGHGENWSTTHTDGVGSVVSAEVLGPTKIGDQNIPNFYWNFCKYNYRLNGQEFPVVNFIVKRK
ncbi:MAG: T9SS type A sorting domain-containing protein, partial [Bacteroidales bacterium]|nr:T9SS type A sorting domain-containing protein [Bacteroidales bacterium]